MYSIVRCGVDVNYWRVAPPRSNAELNLLTVGRLVEKKGMDMLIKAVASHGNWRLTIAGDGPDREKLRVLAQSYDAADRINFLGAVSNQRGCES